MVCASQLVDAHLTAFSRRDERNRIGALDATRGLLLVWMILAHAAFQAGLSPTHWLYRLRLGPVNECFVMLTGVTVALVYCRPRGSSVRPTWPLVRRSLNIAFIAYVSNLVFASLRSHRDGELTLRTAWEIASNQTSWTISGILLATSTTILALSILILASRRIAAWQLFALCGVIGLTATTIHQLRVQRVVAELEHSAWFSEDVVGAPIAVLTGLGVWTFGATWFVMQQPHKRRIWLTVLLASLIWYCAAAGAFGWRPPKFYGANHFASVTAQLVLTMGVVSLMYVGPLTAMQSTLSLLGRSSLMVFLAHRVTIHAQRALLDGHFRGSRLAVLLLIDTTVACIAMCYAKERFEPVERFVRAIGF